MTKNTFLQIRIDSQTKKKAQKTLEELGLDISTVVRMMLKQVANTGFLPYEIRDKNGFTLKARQELQKSRYEAKQSTKKFSKVKDLLKDALK